jgi:hypothetical protein
MRIGWLGRFDPSSSIDRTTGSSSHGIAIASSGGDAKPGAAGNQNPATAPVASKAAPQATAPKTSTTAAPPVAKVACADQEDRSAPCVVTVGSAFALGKHQVLAGWTIKDSGFGMTIAGKAKNISNGASTLFINVKFLRGDEVMANVMCNTGELNAGQIETMNCVPDGTYTKKFDKITAEAAF